MPFTGKVGDTLCLDDSGDGHRYVILTKPDNNGKVVIANFTSTRLWKECLVTFTQRDNPKLFKHSTTVRYDYSRLILLDTLIEIAKTPKSDYVYCNERCVKLVITFAFQSLHTPIGVLDELEVKYPDLAKKFYIK